ncbi:T9SS type A sorting domain-containing protein [Flavihumibacter sp. UBA7668]|uniref:T9SS type A sorting domain-containing protein n=1 Tax=Flavihumibacter sp. UBA7668 TaxID=1946542 RepID=UPI0025B80756|nr:T9SS type A sorting domain-containing protein [Flavihumibacter sp. UBA7668]
MKTYPLNKQLWLLGTLLFIFLNAGATEHAELTSFSAKIENSLVKLNWSAQYEDEFSHFAIERSIDGKTFKDVALYFTEGEQKAKSSFSYKDKYLPKNKNTLYYRLRLINKDGTFQYSAIQLVKGERYDSQLKLALYPNPVQNSLVAALPESWNQQEVVLELYSGSGQLLRTNVEKRAALTLSMDLTNLSPGWYVVKASNGKNSIQGRIVKMN